MQKRLRWLTALILCILVLLVEPVQAQQNWVAILSNPNLQAFPQVELFLDVHTAQGQFVPNLQAAQVQIIENDVAIPAGSLEEIRPGVQVVVAVNPGPAFGIRNSKGFSRYDYLKTALTNWAKSRQGSTLDDWSLIIANGPQVSHVQDPSRWLEFLERDQTDARASAPNLDMLFQAVSLAADQPPRPGMRRAILFITPALEGDFNQPLENLVSQAQQQDIAIFVWIVTSANAPSNPGIQSLENLAAQTGGQSLFFTGEEALPDPEKFLAPLRNIYRLTYLSAVRQGGSQQIIARIQTEGLEIETPAVVFEIDLKPPVPAFISPPIEIERQPIPIPEETDDSQANSEQLIPGQQILEVVLDFPDGRQRPLTQSALYVDGVMVDENLSPPFDQFVWNLETYSNNGTHILQVRVVDNLGLTGASIELPVFVSIESSFNNPWMTMQRNLPALTVMLVIVAGAILLLALLLSGQLRPVTQRAARKKGPRSDPVTQPVAINDSDLNKSSQTWMNRLQWPQRHITPKARAFFSRIAEDETLDASPPIAITTSEVTLGSNPNLASLVIEDASVEGLHARLRILEDGAFRISDEGSMAGTWLNFSPVSKAGARLVHGDLVHIGRVGFRFTLRQPTHIRRPVFTPENGEIASNGDLMT